jgi:hypothetical protein
VTTDHRYRKLYDLDRARGISRTLPADRVGEHVRQLLAAGATVRGIADAASVSPSVVSALSRHTKAKVRRDVAGKLLAITMAEVRARRLATGFVPNLGARRRIQAIGWRHEDISGYLAGTGTRTQMVLHQRGGWITRATHNAVRAAYDAVSMRHGPSSRTRERAGGLGYAPPLAWDDDGIDDPAAAPQLNGGHDPVVDEVAVEQALANASLSGLTKPERLAAPSAIAHRLETSGTVASRLLRHLSPATADTRQPATTQ